MSNRGNGGKTKGYKCPWKGKTKDDLDFLKKTRRNIS